MLRAFRYRNYRLYFAGQVVSFIGSWMTSVATGWLVYRLTGSAWLLGVLAFANQFPGFLLAPLAGIYVDRWNQYRLILATEALLGVASLSLAALTLSGRVTVGALVAFNVMQSLLMAFDIPARQAFVVSIIENKEDLGNAIAMNSITFNTARLIGPALGGLIIAALNEGWCYFIDGVSFIAVIFALLAMTSCPQPARAKQGVSLAEQMREGWEFVKGFLPVRSILMLVAFVSLLGFPFTVLMPVFAKDILQGGPNTLGLLLGSFGAGALIGGTWLASRRSVVGLDRAIYFATMTFGAGVIAFGFSRAFWLSSLLCALAGGSLIILWASSNTIFQTVIDDEKRGRISSFFIMAFMGTSPLGGLLMGRMAEWIGAPYTVSIGGALCIGGAIWFGRVLPEFDRAVRPVYVKLGLIAS